MSHITVSGQSMQPSTKLKVLVHIRQLVNNSRNSWKQKPATKSLHADKELVDITLITDKGGETFSAPRGSLVKQSSFFDEVLSNTEPKSECEIRCHPLVFGQFIDWVNNPRHPIRYKASAYSDEFWIEHAASAWFLSVELQAASFERYALSQFIQNCSMALFGPWDFIEKNALAGSSLRKFSEYWVAWNSRLAGKGRSEYAGLKATESVILTTDQTKDPRNYSLEHWFSPCGRSFDACSVHDASIQGKKKDVKERRIHRPSVEWGADLERRVN
ncbi:hypothetical protein Vi05172_g2963 [Venturia inaequalis]|nr:hypothetical protein Vi05172_g2963 [Venturia inaequalis]